MKKVSLILIILVCLSSVGCSNFINKNGKKDNKITDTSKQKNSNIDIEIIDKNNAKNK